MKCQILLPTKNKKKYFEMSSAEIFTQHCVENDAVQKLTVSFPHSICLLI